jgi:DNA-binding NarL/FixJ family response regulator
MSQNNPENRRDKKIRVSLVEDNRSVAGDLRRWITETEGFECVDVYASAEDALRLLPDAAPDVVLVDLRLPGLSGVDLIRELRVRCPEVNCLVLTMYAESDLIFEAVKAGACGYLLKRIKPEEITEAIRQVHAGGSVMTPRIARRVLEMFAGGLTTDKVQSDEHRLTAREQQILKCMSEGMARKQIVAQIGINPHTLDYVIRCIYRKLHVQCAAAAVSAAVRERIIPTHKQTSTAGRGGKSRRG